MFAATRAHVTVIWEGKNPVLLRKQNRDPKITVPEHMHRKGPPCSHLTPNLKSVTISLHSSLSHSIYIIFKISRFLKITS